MADSQSKPKPEDLSSCLTKCQGSTLQDKLTGMVMGTKLLQRFQHSIIHDQPALTHVRDAFAAKMASLLGLTFFTKLLKALPKPNEEGKIPALSGYQELVVCKYLMRISESTLMSVLDTRGYLGSTEEGVSYLDFINSIVILYIQISKQAHMTAINRAVLAGLLKITKIALNASRGSTLFSSVLQVLIANALNFLRDVVHSPFTTSDTAQATSRITDLLDALYDQTRRSSRTDRLNTWGTFLFVAPLACQEAIDSLLAISAQLEKGALVGADDAADASDIHRALYNLSFAVVHRLMCSAAQLFGIGANSAKDFNWIFPHRSILELRDHLARLFRSSPKGPSVMSSESSTKRNSETIEIVLSLAKLHGPAFLLLPSPTARAISSPTTSARDFVYFEAGLTFSTVAALELQLTLTRVVDIDRRLVVPEDSEFTQEDIQSMIMPKWVKKLVKSQMNVSGDSIESDSDEAEQPLLQQSEQKDNRDKIQVAEEYLHFRNVAAMECLKAFKLASSVYEALLFPSDFEPSMYRLLRFEIPQVNQDSARCPYLGSLETVVKRYASIHGEETYAPIIPLFSDCSIPLISEGSHFKSLQVYAWESQLASSDEASRVGHLAPSTVFLKTHKTLLKSLSSCLEYLTFVFQALPQEKALRGALSPLGSLLHLPLIKSCVMVMCEWLKCEEEIGMEDSYEEDDGNSNVPRFEHFAFKSIREQVYLTLCGALAMVTSSAPGILMSDCCNSKEGMFTWDSEICPLIQLEVCLVEDYSTNMNEGTVGISESENAFWLTLGRTWSQVCESQSKTIKKVGNLSTEKTEADSKRQDTDDEAFLDAALKSKKPQQLEAALRRFGAFTLNEKEATQEGEMKFDEMKSSKAKVQASTELSTYSKYNFQNEWLAEPLKLVKDSYQNWLRNDRTQEVRRVAISSIVPRLFGFLSTHPNLLHQQKACDKIHVTTKLEPSLLSRLLRVLYEYGSHSLLHVQSAFESVRSLSDGTEESNVGYLIQQSKMSFGLCLAFSEQSLSSQLINPLTTLGLPFTPPKLLSSVIDMVSMYPSFRVSSSDACGSNHTSLDEAVIEHETSEAYDLLTILFALLYLSLQSREMSTSKTVNQNDIETPQEKAEEEKEKEEQVISLIQSSCTIINNLIGHVLATQSGVFPKLLREDLALIWTSSDPKADHLVKVRASLTASLVSSLASGSESVSLPRYWMSQVLCMLCHETHALLLRSSPRAAVVQSTVVDPLRSVAILRSVKSGNNR